MFLPLFIRVLISNIGNRSGGVRRAGQRGQGPGRWASGGRPRRSSKRRESRRCADDLPGHTKRAAGRTWGRRQPNAATPPDATEARRKQLEGSGVRAAPAPGARRARGQGRRDAPPTELSVAGMLTHGHTSTVSSAGMTDHILIRAHRRLAHSRLSLSSSTHPPASEGQRRFVHSGQGGRHGISAFTKTESC